MEGKMRSITAKAVIGAGYGDEGKGLLTDWLAAAQPGSVVVRSNGGAQAGHSAVTPSGARHVFHHVGSGALAGAATHLSRYFVAHPMLLLEEWKLLRDLGANLDIGSDPRTLVTTPFDMMINQAVEEFRSAGRHGSCGIGFGETIERNLRPQFALSTQDLFRPDLEARLRRIRADWVPARLKQLGVAHIPDRVATALIDDGVVARFLADCEAYLDCVKLWPDRRIAERGPVIFEGAQGLLLDQDFGAFPYVTRSNTGLKNMLSIAGEAGITAIDAVYATRCYTTRHGAGPLDGEVERLNGIAVDDPTNAPNAWQGTLRLAPLDTGVLRTAIAHDLGLASAMGPKIGASLAVTCLDQASDVFAISGTAGREQLSGADAARLIARTIGLPLFGESWGPARTDFRPFATNRLLAA
jgi:adenylosuccinate synthase